MKLKTVALVLLLPFLFSCKGSGAITPPDFVRKEAVAENTEDPSDPGENQDPEEPQDPEIPEDAFLVTNPLMEKYLEEVNYPEGDWSYSKILDYPGGGVDGVGDIPPSVTISWPEGAAGNLTLTLTEGDWSRQYSVSAGKTSFDVTNLVPGKRYDWTVTASDGKEFAEGHFWTKGHLHQTFFTKQVHNGRDLGGWKTTDGHTVKFRKIYRSGKPSENYVDAAGIKDMRAEGIRAQLDLREVSSSHDKSSPLGSDVDFYCGDFLNGYKAMMEEGDKVKKCFEFVVNSLREDKPVLFHCSIGSDRTGTFSILLLGLLGVSEPDCCKEYEITYFAPEKWSVTNGKVDRLRTNKNRYLQAINYILNFGTYKDFRSCVEKYFLSIGVSQKDINDFRTLMLE